MTLCRNDTLNKRYVKFRLHCVGGGTKASAPAGYAHKDGRKHLDARSLKSSNTHHEMATFYDAKQFKKSGFKNESAM